MDDETDVFDDDLMPVIPGSGVVGHLARSGHVPLGYLGDPAGTSRAFVEHGGRRWALPGDLATVEADGAINVLGRGSLCINTGGEKVFPDEVEAVLKDHPDVADAIVVGLPDPRFGERVTALVQPRPRHHLDVDQLAEHARQRLSPYKVPRRSSWSRRFVVHPAANPTIHGRRSSPKVAVGGQRGK